MGGDSRLIAESAKGRVERVQGPGEKRPQWILRFYGRARLVPVYGFPTKRAAIEALETLWPCPNCMALFEGTAETTCPYCTATGG